MVAKVSVVPDGPRVTQDAGNRPPKTLRAGVALILLCTLVGFGIVIYAHHSGGIAPAQAVAVLPFSDLTSEAMDEEYFADGMTEELIDRLSHVPGLRVPAATSSFALKGKKLSIAEVGKALGVAYVLDGSVRESDSTMRITARLARVQDGYVVWSQSYDRPAQDKLKVQEDIAREVAASLAASVKP
jgi:transcriptional activator of cad operon